MEFLLPAEGEWEVDEELLKSKPNTRAVQSVLVSKSKPNPIEAEVKWGLKDELLKSWGKVEEVELEVEEELLKSWGKEELLKSWVKDELLKSWGKVEEVEWEVEEELLKSWGKVDVVDGEFDVAFCTTSELDEAMVFMIKIPDPEACPPLPYFIPPPRPPPPSILNHIKGVKKKKITTKNNSSSSFTPKKIIPVSKVVKDGPPGPYPSCYYAVLDGHLYSVGGRESRDPDFSASTIKDVCENYTLSHDNLLNIVSSIPTTDVWMLNLKCPGKVWERAPFMKYRRQNPQTIVVDGKLYVFGGGLGWLQPKDTCSGWMEAYDPKSRIWETLPNPPTYSKVGMDVIFAHLNFKDEKQIIINGPPVLERDSNEKGHYIAYNVESRSWNHRFNEAHLSWAEEVQCKRAQVVSTTLYWTTLLTEDTDMIFIYGYNLYSRGWTRREVYIRSILIEGEDFLPTGPGFLHLADFKFCLLLFSYRRPHYYLNCLIFDLHGEATDTSILSVQKYLLDSYLQFLDCMIVEKKKKKKKNYTSKRSAGQRLLK